MLELYGSKLPRRPYYIESKLIHVEIQPITHNITGVVEWSINNRIHLIYDFYANYSNNVDNTANINNIIVIIFLADKSIS